MNSDYYMIDNNNNLLSQKFLTEESKNKSPELNQKQEIEYDIKNVNIICYNNIIIININNTSIKINENIELKPYDEEIFVLVKKI